MVLNSAPAAWIVPVLRGPSKPFIWLNLLPLFVAFLHVHFSPDTKVEESFSLHAVHDFLVHGYSLDNLSKFDHSNFPGPLPRSFIPSLLLSLPVRFLALSLARMGLIWDKFHLQLLTRFTLAFVSALSLLFVGRQLAKAYGRVTGEIFILLSTTQFHLMYYAGRTLPNFMALPFVNLSLGLLLSSRPGPALAILTATAAIVRSELALLLAPVVVLLLATRRISVTRALLSGALGGFGGMFTSVSIDSTYWSRPYLWPELYTIYFNVVQGKASEWGVSPWSYYLRSLPLLLLTSLPLLVLAILHPALRRKTWFLVVPPAMMIIALSFLGHKEWRFIAYTVVWFNAAASVAGGWIWSNCHKTTFHRLLALALIGGLLINCVVSSALTDLSMGNYPGGEIMRLLHELERNATGSVHLHSPSLPLQTGSTLFHTLRSQPPHSSPLYPTLRTPFWTYDKTEYVSPPDLTPSRAREAGYTHVILEEGQFERDGWEQEGWEVLGSRSGFGGVGVRRRRNEEGKGETVKEVWKLMGTGGWELVVREGEKVVLVRRVGFGRREQKEL